MREKVLQNERYGAVEVDKTGIITGYNSSGFDLLSGACNIMSAELKGINITEFTGTGKTVSFSPELAEELFSSFCGIKVIDSIPYKESDAVIVRFALNNDVYSPLLDMIQFSSVLFLELDSSMNIIFASDSFCKIAGMEKYEIYGSHISVFTDAINSDIIKSNTEIFKKNIFDSIKLDEIKFLFNGIERYYDMEISPVREKGNVFSGIFCHLRDKTFEKKFKKMSISTRRMSAMANFASGIAHDYNNALTAVLGNISLAKMDAQKNSELEELLRDAESAGLKIKKLTERLGMFARGMKPAKDQTDIKKLIMNTVPEIFSGYKGQYKLNIQDNMMYPEIDQDLIGEAFRHVIENAVEASDRPDGEILIEAEEAEINKESAFRETSLVSGRYIVVSVRDNGPGLDPLTSREIFDPYISSKPGREGLGLSLAYTILKRHRGFISVETPEGGGTHFNIYIPLF